MITIRKAERNDAQAAFEVRNRAILSKCTGHYSEQQLQTWISGSISEAFEKTVEKSFYVAVKDGEIVATGMITFETGMVDAIFVDPDQMGYGLAKAMINHIEKLAVSAGLTVLKLESTLNAASFYRSCGFEGDEVSTYQSAKGVTLSCVPMVKKLQSSA